MANNRRDSTMSAPSFLASQEEQQQQCAPATGNNAIMNMMNSRQYSKLTANIYGNQSVNPSVPSSALMPPQPQLTNNSINNSYNNMSCNGANTVNCNNGIVNCQNNIMPTNIANNNIVNNNTPSTNNTAQQQVQIAGLNGITFTLPQASNASVPNLANYNHSGTIDALTLSSLNGTVPEFLYQLTKMLTDEGNKEVIVWNPGMTLGNHQIGGCVNIVFHIILF